MRFESDACHKLTEPVRAWRTFGMRREKRLIDG